MQIPLTNKDAISDHGAKRVMDRGPFIKVGGVFNKDVMRVLRCVEKDNTKGAKVETADITTKMYHAQVEVQSISGMLR